MVALAWRPGRQAALPMVSPVRWWLYRIATAVAASFVAVAIVYLPHCKAYYGNRIQTHPVVLSCHPPWPTLMRIEVALTGVLVGLLIAFIGARIDRMIVRSRGLRGAALLPSS
jgi:hypothetical protein